MAKSSDYDDIVRAAVALRGEAPAAWENFLMSVRAFSAKQAGAMVVAPPERLVWAQGFAFATSEMAEKLRTAPELFDAMQAAAVTKARKAP